ncbi:Predicted kinase, aminoglycoside phosphotransferase (APT) family [Rhodococcus triatomae]|uniref:Predicted kinase, aminoglycoside phosphotransferase (APT) family n=1 Tax=Rhodococcus triatomae TaxID=300028 RepID=A0A1G8GT89_9NOCA|nr:phosphotransferase family protein [Rhodococcus triatomae]SDH97589.1 Predicted kinase, aminoglycoside phosphotransferase (APT) family [Rhodococcus triatomae]
MSAIPAGDQENFSEVARPSDSRRDPDTLRTRLEQWLATKVPGGTPVVTEVHEPDANGMSSETILFDAVWDDEHHPLVARVAPTETAIPVFPSYDLHQQFTVMNRLFELGAAPVPRVYWSEPDPEPLGAPFFVMERAAGRIPPDVMPYNFGSWVTEGTDADRTLMERESVAVLGALHAIAEPATTFPFLLSPGCGTSAGETFRAHVQAQRAYYEWTTRTGPRSPLVERGFDWIEQRLPDDPSPAVFCWGDARIGNIVYDGFRPRAVLDWEMATLGPREMDLGWMVFLHRFFEDIASVAGLDGLPDFLRIDEAAATYHALTGHAPIDLPYYVVYAALRHATIMLRIQTRAIHFGQAAPPDDPDDMILHRSSLEAMLDDTYWERLR